MDYVLVHEEVGIMAVLYNKTIVENIKWVYGGRCCVIRLAGSLCNASIQVGGRTRQ